MTLTPDDYDPVTGKFIDKGIRPPRWVVEQARAEIADRGSRFAEKLEAVFKQATAIGITAAKGDFSGGLSVHTLAKSLYDAKPRERKLDAGPGCTSLMLADSDFPTIAGEMSNRILVPAFEQAPGTFESIARMVEFSSFQVTRFAKLDGFPPLLQNNEHSEFKFGSLGDSYEQGYCLAWGRIIRTSRKLWVNDDLRGIAQVVQGVGMRAKVLINQTLFATLILPNSGMGVTLVDTNTIWHANHSNVTGAGSLAWNTTLSSAFNLIQGQALSDGSKPNIAGSILLVSPASLALAKSIVPVGAVGDLTIVADAQLSGTRFYLFAPPNIAPCLAVGGLQGPPVPKLITRYGFETESIDYKAVLDFGVAPLDYRWTATGAGA